MYTLKWLIKQNVPVVCEKGLGTWSLRSDAWLAGSFEKLTLNSTIRHYFHVDVGLEKKHVVFHRVPFWNGVEYAVEVFGEGVRFGLLYYDSRGSWGIVPSGALASILVGLGANSVEIKENPLRRLKNKRLVLGEHVCVNRDYLLINVGEYVGVAKVGNTERCVIKVKDLAPRGFKVLGEPLPGDLVNYNKDIVERVASEARLFIKRVYEKYVAPNKVHVSFSGGADSTAVLLLAVEELGPERVVAVYSDTGLEYPETAKYVEEIASKLGIELIVLKPRVNPLEEIRRRGLMSVKNRWCTRLLKLEPLKEYYYSRGVKLYLDGARNYESTLRAKTPRLSENPTLPSVHRALPIKTWPRILVQLYLASRGVSQNPLYDRGLTRIGCVVCPAMHRYELRLSYEMCSDVHGEVLRASRLSLEEYLSMKWSGKRIFSGEV